MYMYKRFTQFLADHREKLAVAVVPVAVFIPSFSIDIDTVLTQAFNWVNSLMPVYAVPLGITLGLGILGMLYSLLSKAFKTRG